MPLFCIHAIDHPDKGHLRAAHYPAHRAFLAEAAAHGVAIAASGPLVSADATATIGSLFLLEAPDMQTARAFNAADPFAAAGLWQAVRIDRFDLKRGSVGAGGNAGPASATHQAP